MFQKGQLVQSRKYGDYYVVVCGGYGACKAKPLSKKFWFAPTMFFPAERLRLIGNNYRPKARK